MCRTISIVRCMSILHNLLTSDEFKDIYVKAKVKDLMIKVKVKANSCTAPVLMVHDYM